MKLKLVKSIVALVLFFVSFSAMAEPIITGGEVPWPLAHQYRITAENSRGLWKLEQQQGMKYYNVEILDQVEGTTFVRVSELDPKTLKVVSWGEGFFKASQQKTTISTDYWADYFIGGAHGIADVGRYLYMYPNGDITEAPYMLRLVEVRTSLNISLGISIYPLASALNKEHVLGSRLQEDPLNCRFNDPGTTLQDRLTCHFPEEPSSDNQEQ